MRMVIFPVHLHGIWIEGKKEKKKVQQFHLTQNIPYNVSFLVWRALRCKLPTNEKLHTFNVESVACFCCFRPGLDDVEHIFITGNFAAYIWKYYSGSFGLIHSHITLKGHLIKWGLDTENEVHKLISQALPIFICWNLWKKRCSAQYGLKQGNVARVKYLIYKDISQLLNTSFP